MKLEKVRLHYVRGAKRIKEGGASKITNLDYYELRAIDHIEGVESRAIEGQTVVLYRVEAVYSVRIPMPKWFRSVMKYFTQDFFTSDDFRLGNELNTVRSLLISVLREDFNIANRGYQPGLGFVTIETSRINEYADANRARAFAKAAYHCVRGFQKEVLKKAIQAGYVLPQRLRWQRDLYQSLGL